MSLCAIPFLPSLGKRDYAGLCATSEHTHACTCTHMSLSLFCILHTLVGTGTFFSILTQAHTGTLHSCLHHAFICTHFHCHTCLACSLTLSHREPSLRYTHCPLHTPNPCSQVSLDHMSSCGGGAVWPRLLLPAPPPGMGGRMLAPRTGDQAAALPQRCWWLLTGPSGHLAVSPGF